MRQMIFALPLLALAACQGQGGGGASAARDQIRAVGSSTVYPFAQEAVGLFTQANPGMKAPIIESTGTGAGMKLFCAGVGSQHPDIENASRRMKKSEFDQCQANGVKEMDRAAASGSRYAAGARAGLDQARPRPRPSCRGQNSRSSRSPSRIRVERPILPSRSRNGRGGSSSILAIFFTSHSPLATRSAAATAGTPAV